ncbi:MAG: FeoA family protein [Fastidiosipilaceae bacterium]|jgi:ferrous iron transport protein A
MMTLREAKNKERYIVEKSLLKQPAKRRLEAMGLIEGTMVFKINEALDGSIIFMIRGSRLAIGSELAEMIEVRNLTDEDLRQRGRGRGRGPRFGRGKGRGRGRGNDIGGSNAAVGAVNDDAKMERGGKIAD